MKVISYFTSDGPYQTAAEDLIASLREHDLPFEIHPYTTEQNWCLNTNKKPDIILKMRRLLRGPLLFLDADMIVIRKPDFSCIPDLDRNDIWVTHMPDHVTASTSLIYINDSEYALEFIEAWLEEAKKDPYTPDNIHFTKLARETSAVFGTLNNLVRRYDDPPTADACFEHRVLSRTARDDLEPMHYTKKINDLKGTLTGSHFLIAGCGPSAKALELIAPKYWSVGVNDVGRYFTPDFLMVVDNQLSFEYGGRWHYIKTSKAGMVVLNKRYKLKVNHPNPVYVEVLNPQETGGQPVINEMGKLPLHRTSTIPAAVFAYQLGARKIGLIGADFTEDHSTYEALNEIEACYTKIRDHMNAEGVELVNLSPISNLTCLPQGHLRDFLTKQEFTKDMVLRLQREESSDDERSTSSGS